MKTLVQHLQEINDTMKEGGLNEKDRMCCLSKIGSIAMHSSICGQEEIVKACDYIDACVLESDEVSEELKAMVKLSSLIRSF